MTTYFFPLFFFKMLYFEGEQSFGDSHWSPGHGVRWQFGSDSYTGEAIVRTWRAGPAASLWRACSWDKHTMKKEGKTATGLCPSKERAWPPDFPGRLLLDISFLDLLASHFPSQTLDPELDSALSSKKGSFPRSSNYRSLSSRGQAQG